MRPIHPDEILRKEYVAPLGLSGSFLARALAVIPARINGILGERRGIAAYAALRLARYFGPDARSWMNLQAAEFGGQATQFPNPRALIWRSFS
jgi:addiction module HigA family antidote